MVRDLAFSALQRYEYLVADLPHFSRGQVERVDSGNLPKFAEGRARDFWCAADGYERINGRVFSEIEAALPHELTAIQNEVLAGETVQDLLGGSFPYTMAIIRSWMRKTDFSAICTSCFVKGQ